jgi:hypothetical protein
MTGCPAEEMLKKDKRLPPHICGGSAQGHSMVNIIVNVVSFPVTFSHGRL